MSNIDNKVNEILKKIEEKKLEVKNAEETSKRKWLTNCVIPFNIYTGKNLKTLNKVELMDFLAELIMRKDALEKSYKILGETETAIVLSGFTFEQWFEDCKTRYAVITLKEKIEKLIKLEQIAESLQSEELKKQKTLEKLEKELEDINKNTSNVVYRGNEVT